MGADTSRREQLSRRVPSRGAADRVRILLGSDRPISFDLEALKKRFQDPAVQTALEAAEWNIDAIAKFIGTSQVKVWQPDSVRPQGDVNTDLFPRDEFYLNRAR